MTLWSVGTLMILVGGLLVLYIMKNRIKEMERRLVKAAIEEESWLGEENMMFIGIDYKHPSFKKLDQLLSSKNSACQNVVVFLDAPPFIHLIKQRAWNSCQSVRHTPEWANSKWIALLGGETVAYEYDGHKLHRYTEVEMLLELKIKSFQSKEESLCEQQSADNFL